MKKINTVPQIENENFLLREILLEDASDLIEISRYDNFSAKTEEDVIQILKWIQRDTIAGESLHWGIVQKSSSEMIGTVGFYRGFEKNIGEIGYVLKEEFRGRGIMTEVVSVVTDFTFLKLDLSGVKAYTDYGNKASVRVLNKCGFTSEDNNGEGLVFSRMK